MQDYPNEPDDGHEHEFSAEDNLPDTGTDAETVICLKCGALSAIDPCCGCGDPDCDFDCDGDYDATYIEDGNIVAVSMTSI